MEDASSVQLADEIQRSGRPVTLAVGGHTRLPRRHRGRDIVEWLDRIGRLRETTAEVHDLEVARRSPSYQQIGSDDHRSLDLATLTDLGVRLVGRVAGLFPHGDGCYPYRGCARPASGSSAHLGGTNGPHA